MSSSIQPQKSPLEILQRQYPVPVLSEDLVSLAASVDPDCEALSVVRNFNDSLARNDAAGLAKCFFAEQAWWKDELALTYHLRTFATPDVIAAGLLKTTNLRGGIPEGITLEEAAHFIPATKELQFIDCRFRFNTLSPKAKCIGRMMLLPVKTGEKSLVWKIWILSTCLKDIDLEKHQEDESLLRTPGRDLDNQTMETEVVIVGGGNAAAALSARLKSLRVESIMLERNPNVGDNWALRYENLAFHVPTSYCDMPYLAYPEELRSPGRMMTKDELAEHLTRYVTNFGLNILTSAKILRAQYNKSDKRWTVEVQTSLGPKTIISKQLVQATGIGSQKPFVPILEGDQRYTGVSMHSSQYKSAAELKERGIKSVVVIGSANTAFDIIENCHKAGLQTTMIVRSPTLMCPVSYITDATILGIYDKIPVEAADRILMTVPSVISSQLMKGSIAFLASKEPDRYDALEKTGFPVVRPDHNSANLMSNLIERGGGHYVDMGVTKLIEEREVGLKANVYPMKFTTTGLLLSDNSTVDANAVVWCTGFADKDVRDTAAEILGGPIRASSEAHDRNVLGPEDIAPLLDVTWGIDSEGEIRGMWKRHVKVDNYWVMGGFTQQHRWYSKTLALQLLAAVKDILPEAYRDTPGPMC